MNQPNHDRAESLPIPAPDLKVIDQMQIGFVKRFTDVKQAKLEGKPVVYTTVLAPREILQAMGVPYVFGNVLGAYVSIFGYSAKYCQIAEDLGLSREVCAAHRCTVGLSHHDEREDFFNLAYTEPDLVIGTNFPCSAESKSFLHVIDRYKTPSYIIDTPANTWKGPVPEHAVKYLARQYQGMISFLEEHGYTLDMDKLREEVAFSKRLNELIAEVEVYRRAVPTPIKAYDSVIAACTPLLVSKESGAELLFEKLRDELKERVDNGIGIVPNERLRLLWIGIPPLCDFKLLNYPEKHGAVVAKSLVEFLTGFNLDPDLIDPDNPMESLARASIASPINPTSQGMVDYFVQAVKDYRIDGVVSITKRTCCLLPGSQRLIKDAIFKETGVPSVIFDLDCIDARDYDAAAAHANLDSFVEILMAKKERHHE